MVAILTGDKWTDNDFFAGLTERLLSTQFRTSKRFSHFTKSGLSANPTSRIKADISLTDPIAAIIGTMVGGLMI